jgi:ATP-dependent Lon protease
LYEVGTIGKVLHTKQNDDGMLVALVRGLNRFRVTGWHPGDAHLSASVVHAPEIVESGLEMEVLQRELRKMIKDVLSTTPNIAGEAVEAIDQITDPLQLTYVAATHLNLETQERQTLLEIDSVSEKIRKLMAHLSKEKEMLNIGRKIKADIQRER